MASLIKNQIIKRLSKFVKNLSSNQINLSTIKGEGELSSINLDEKAIEDVIELPTWLKIQTATCGRLFIKIPWTSLKTLPIQIQLDDVNIEIETCEKLRDFQSSGTAIDPTIGKYGFTNRVIDGISLSITNLTLSVKSRGFKASFMLPTFDVYSVTPTGKRVDTLTATRLRNTTQGYILLFKEVSWPNARIEASSNDGNASGASIRFIVNACQVKIAMKKNLQDSSMIASRLIVQFDDFLSVLNDAQLKSVLNTYKEIKELMARASEQRKRIAGEKINRTQQFRQPAAFQAKLSNRGPEKPTNPIAALNPDPKQIDPFVKFDVVETSLHFTVKRLDLHMIADSDVSEGRVVENGALQMTIANFSFDHYPYHEYGSSKKHWFKYNEVQSINRSEWVSKLHEDWYEQLSMAKASAPKDDTSSKFERALRTNQIRLFEACSVINIDDLVFYPVSLNKDRRQKRRRPLIASDKTYYHLPDSLGIFNIQRTEYYYPAPYAFPVPDADVFVQIMPLVIRADFATVAWIDAFVSSLFITIDDSGILKTDEPSVDPEHVSIRLEAMLPRIIISSEIFSGNRDLESSNNDRSPGYDSSQPAEISTSQKFETLEISVSKLLLTNTRTEPSSTRSKLTDHLELFEQQQFFHQTQWPFSKQTTTTMSPLFSRHPYDTYMYTNPLSQKTANLPNPKSDSTALHTYYTMTTDSLKKVRHRLKFAKYDIWHFHAENVYLDYTPSTSSDSIRLAQQNMVDGLSITGWFVIDANKKNTWLSVLGVVEVPTILKISRKQYTFVMRLADELGLFVETLERTKNQTLTFKKQPSVKNPDEETKVTVCLNLPTSFTLAILDDFEDSVIHFPMTSASSVSEADAEPLIRDPLNLNVSSDAPTRPSTILCNSSKLEASTPIKSIDSPGQRKFKLEGVFHRGMDAISKSGRGLSISSGLNMSDAGDDTASLWDAAEDLDAEVDQSIFGSDFDEQQPKVARIDIDDDSLSLVGKTQQTIKPLESVNGVFIKLNQINVCVAEDLMNDEKQMFIACNVKYIRIDEFSSLKFDTIKPKLFDNQRLDEYNNESVPPINIRIDFPKSEMPTPPFITLRMQDRILKVTSHAIDVITQNLEEILTPELRILRETDPPKQAPIDIHLSNVQITLEPLPVHPVRTMVTEIRPPLRLIIERVHLLRQIDGQVIIRKMTISEDNDEKQEVKSLQENLQSTDDVSEQLKQLELLRSENERLRSELGRFKTEVGVLRGERDSLMSTVSKLDIELTQAEYQRISQQQQQERLKLARKK